MTSKTRILDNAQPRRIRCRRDGERVTVDLWTPDSRDRLFLTIDEASSLADHLLCELLDINDQQRAEHQPHHDISVCDVLMTVAEATELVRQLEHATYRYETERIAASRTCGAKVDWQREGF